jgi:riboflavin synthase
MFTGLITAIGTIVERHPRAGGLDLTLAMPWTDLAAGESIAVRGACLTVASLGQGTITVHVVGTSLERTCFGSMPVGSRVNLERALRVGDRLGGHWVQGHVDGVGNVLAARAEGSVHLIEVELPAVVADVTIPLGSIAVDGVSLTANAMPSPLVMQLAIVPHTMQHTTLPELRAGDLVHLEGDLVGKHVRALATSWNVQRDTT